MRVFNQGAHVRVTVSAREVDAFKRTWPCSGLPDRGVSFTFDARNGDLVDFAPDELDGDDALALSHDANNYAARKLGRPELTREEQ